MLIEVKTIEEHLVDAMEHVSNVVLKKDDRISIIGTSADCMKLLAYVVEKEGEEITIRNKNLGSSNIEFKIDIDDGYRTFVNTLLTYRCNEEQDNMISIEWDPVVLSLTSLSTAVNLT